jgi:hypothetical protein
MLQVFNINSFDCCLLYSWINLWFDFYKNNMEKRGMKLDRNSVTNQFETGLEWSNFLLFDRIGWIENWKNFKGNFQD